MVVIKLGTKPSGSDWGALIPSLHYNLHVALVLTQSMGQRVGIQIFACA